MYMYMYIHERMSHSPPAGVNVDIGNDDGKTALELLQGFTADKAREIRQLILGTLVHSSSLSTV